LTTDCIVVFVAADEHKRAVEVPALRVERVAQLSWRR